VVLRTHRTSAKWDGARPGALLLIPGKLADAAVSKILFDRGPGAPAKDRAAIIAREKRMTKHLERDMESIHREILALSGMVEQAIDRARRALLERKLDLAAQVIEEDEEIDRCEVHVEEECLKILALHQPVAIDLRRIATVLKVNSDLERIADLAANIAERAQALAEYPDFPIPAKLERMIDLAMIMVRHALDAFVNMDAQGARHVCMLDDEVDRYNREVIEELYERMDSDRRQIRPALHCFSASRHAERIADHATNIAEDVIYLVEGEIARHRHDGVHLPREEKTQWGARKS
jgi:phosphate transport system protein